MTSVHPVWRNALELGRETARGDTGRGQRKGSVGRGLEIACCIQTRISRVAASILFTLQNGSLVFGTPYPLLLSLPFSLPPSHLSARLVNVRPFVSTPSPLPHVPRHCFYFAAGLADDTMKYVKECVHEVKTFRRLERYSREREREKEKGK